MTKSTKKAAKAVAATVAQAAGTVVAPKSGVGAHTADYTPLAALYCAPENARFGDTSDVAGLAASIEERGDLLETLKAYLDGDRVAVWDGGRRLRALALLEAEGRLPDLLATRGVPYFPTSREEARIGSLATFVRDDMHPADAFQAFSRLFDDGLSTEQVAAACHVGARDVAQIMRFRTLAPEVLAAFKEGKFELDAALAFTVTDDHDRQRAVLKSCGKNVAEYDVRRRITEGAVSPHTAIARFIGRDAYVAAGGQVFTDLFSRFEMEDLFSKGDDANDWDADEEWADKGLVERLAAEKLAAALATVKTEGWGAVIEPKNQYGWSNGYERLEKQDVETKKGKTAKDWSAEQRAAGVAFAYIDSNGKLKIERGWYKPSKKASMALLGAGVPATPQADPRIAGFGHTGHHKLTSVATRATQVGLLENPTAAYDALLTHLAWEGLSRKGGSRVSRLHTGNDRARALDVSVKGGKAYADALTRWSDKLPWDRLAFCDAVAALEAGEKAELLALCFAETVDGTEAGLHTYTRDAGRWSHLGWIAEHAGVRISEAWTPDEAFLKGASKDALISALVDMGLPEKDAQKLQSDKKAVLVGLVATKMAEVGWTPAILRDLMDVDTKAKAETARAERKASGKPLDDEEAAEFEDEAAEFEDEDDAPFEGDDDDDAAGRDLAGVERDDAAGETFADEEAEAAQT